MVASDLFGPARSLYVMARDPASGELALASDLELPPFRKVDNIVVDGAGRVWTAGVSSMLQTHELITALRKTTGDPADLLAGAARTQFHCASLASMFDRATNETAYYLHDGSLQFG